MKKVILVFLLSTLTIFGQRVDYYGNSFGDANSSSLIITNGTSESGIYVPNGDIIQILVDSNWTASGISFLIYNYLEQTWVPLKDNDQDLLEYTISVSSPVTIQPIYGIMMSRVKFKKTTSGSPVNQSGSSSKLQINTKNIVN